MARIVLSAATFAGLCGKTIEAAAKLGYGFVELLPLKRDRLETLREVRFRHKIRVSAVHGPWGGRHWKQYWSTHGTLWQKLETKVWSWKMGTGHDNPWHDIAFGFCVPINIHPNTVYEFLNEGLVGNLDINAWRVENPDEPSIHEGLPGGIAGVRVAIERFEQRLGRKVGFTYDVEHDLKCENWDGCVSSFRDRLDAVLEDPVLAPRLQTVHLCDYMPGGKGLKAGGHLRPYGGKVPFDHLLERLKQFEQEQSRELEIVVEAPGPSASKSALALLSGGRLDFTGAYGNAEMFKALLNLHFPANA
jgi:sugar phosphate isomerase/epimerase